MLYGLINFSTFLSGVVFGILICGVGAFHFIASSKKKSSTSDGEKVEESSGADEDETIPIGLTKADMEKLHAIIEYLDEVNSPLKSMGGILQKIHSNKEIENGLIEAKMKTIVDLGSLSRLEKEHYDNVSELKDHAKQIKLMSSFLHDLSRAVSSFSKDLAKLGSTARSNMNKNSSMETKEDMIVNAWWQCLQTAVDHLAEDQEELSNMITNELQNVSLNIQEEISLIEKRLSLESTRYFGALRESIQLFETRLRERDKCKEKLRVSSISSTAGSLLGTSADQAQKRQLKLKQAEEALVLQTRRLYDAQRDFYVLLPRVSSDVQLTVLKSIIETQSQLMKLADGVERVQNNGRSVCRRLRSQLTNAAASMVQMISSESKLLLDLPSTDGDASAGNTSFALEVMRARQAERLKGRGVAGYELTLQRVLEVLVTQAQQASNINNNSANNTNNMVSNGAAEEIMGASPTEPTSVGKLDMFAETTAALAANNPTLLPDLPRQFAAQAIGLETCIWFNAICGRVYRDMAESDYFHNWFKVKLAAMLNKGKRPGYVDAFEVTQVTFGDQPPLLMNLKWFPPAAKRSKHAQASSGAANPHEEDADNNSDNDSDNENIDPDAANSTRMANDFSDQLPSEETGCAGDDDMRYYAACNADIVCRSGLQFTVATRFWLNWPRDRYASVPVFIHLDLAELQGRVRFGVKRSHSFLSFLKDPLTRISVRSEVGSDRYKLRDIPQVSDYIVRKLKSFIHRKIVYPQAHKFRLIWPRNWWPTGTENLFSSTTPEADGIRSKDKDSDSKTKDKESKAKDTRDFGAQTDRSEENNASSNSINNVHMRSSSVDDAENTLRSSFSLSPSTKAVAAAVLSAVDRADSSSIPASASVSSKASSHATNTAGSPPAKARDASDPAAASSSTAASSSAAASSQEALWQQHLRKVAQKLNAQQDQQLQQQLQTVNVSSDTSSATSSPSPPPACTPGNTPLPSEESERLVALQLREVFRKFSDNNSHRAQQQQQQQTLIVADELDESLGNGQPVVHSGYALFSLQTKLHPGRRVRAMSLSELRPEVLSAALEDALSLNALGDDDCDDKDEDKDRGRLLVGFRRPAATAPKKKKKSNGPDACGTAGNSKRRASAAVERPVMGRQRTHTLTSSHSMYMNPTSSNFSLNFGLGGNSNSNSDVTTRRSMNTTRSSIRSSSSALAPSDSTAASAGGAEGELDLDAAARWLKTRGKEHVDKARAKFLEFKNRHFGSDANSNSSSHGSTQGSSHGMDSNSYSYSSSHGASSTSASQARNTSPPPPPARTPSAATSHTPQQQQQSSAVKRSSFSNASSSNTSSEAAGREPTMKKIVASIFNKDSDDSASSSSASSGLNSMFSKALNSVRQHMQDKDGNS